MGMTKIGMGFDKLFNFASTHLIKINCGNFAWIKINWHFASIL
jgi:hypothetical protein